MKAFILSIIDKMLIFAFCFIVFILLIYNVPTDIQPHVSLIPQINHHTASYPANFLFYFLVNLFSGFSSTNIIMYTVTAVILSLAVVAKYEISKRIIIDLSPEKINVTLNHVKLIALALTFCFTLPNLYTLYTYKIMYTGKFVPNVWHNSTTILLFPFALLLFWQQFKSLDSDKPVSLRTILILTLLVILNAITKPSFLFAFVPVTGLFILFKLNSSNYKNILRNTIPIISGILLIICLYLLLYHFQPATTVKDKSAIVLTTPFYLYSLNLPLWYLPIALITSFILPLLTWIFYAESFSKYKPFIYSLCLSVTGLLISAFLIESGPRLSHGNFLWQNVICSYIILLSCVTFLLPKLDPQKKLSGKMIVLTTIFLLQFLSGILYLIKIAITKSWG